MPTSGKSRLYFLFFLITVIMLSSFYSGMLYRQQLDYNDAIYSIIESKRFQAKSYASINKEYLRCMATNIYHEAGNEPFMGQVMVARVVMNRIKHGFAKNPCAVIYAKNQVELDSEQYKTVCQFNWVCEGKQTPERNLAYRQAEDIARKVLTENAWNDVVPNNVLFFHNTTVNPNWKYEKVMTVGNHIFYAKKRNNTQQ